MLIMPELTQGADRQFQLQLWVTCVVGPKYITGKKW